MRTRRAQQIGGFTLIEMTAVVLLVALLLTTVIVRIDRMLPSTSCEAAARELLSALDMARTTAISTGRTHSVELDLDNARYRQVVPFDKDNNPTTLQEEMTGLEWLDLPTGVLIRQVMRVDGMPARRGRFRVPFDPLGSSDELFLYLGNEKQEEYTITVRLLALTGQARVIQGWAEHVTITEDTF